MMMMMNMMMRMWMMMKNDDDDYDDGDNGDDEDKVRCMCSFFGRLRLGILRNVAHLPLQKAVGFFENVGRRRGKEV